MSILDALGLTQQTPRASNIRDYTAPAVRYSSVGDMRQGLEQAIPFKGFYDHLGDQYRDQASSNLAGDLEYFSYPTARTPLGEFTKGLPAFVGNLGIGAVKSVDPILDASTLLTGPLQAFGRQITSPSYQTYLDETITPIAEDILAQQGYADAEAAKAERMRRGSPTFGPTYEQTPTPEDQAAALIARENEARSISDESGSVSIMPDGSLRGGNIFEDIARLTSDPYAIQEKLNQAITPKTAEQVAAEEAAEQAAGGQQRTIEGDATDVTEQFDDLVETQASGDVEGIDLGTGGAGRKDESPAETAFKSGYDAYLQALGEDKDIGSIEDYKKEFADATGIDISGKVDNSAALMAFGLALMQNKAGKGFNVGNILSSVGEAGESALPLMAQAKKEARAAQLAGGKYALEQRKAAKANRQALLEAERDRLNELAKMDLDFRQKKRLKEIQHGLDKDLQRLEHEQTLLESEFEGVDLYLETTEAVPLFEGAGKEFTVNAFKQNPNLPKRYKNKDIPLLLTNSAKTLRPLFDAAEADLNRLEADLAGIAEVALQDGITVQDQVTAGLRSFGRAFGINVDGDLSPLEQAQQTLRKIEVQRTAEILGEAGKTISDADRRLVTDIVGRIGALNLTDLSGADAQRLVNRLDQLHGIIVEKGRRNLDTARKRLVGTDYEVAPYTPDQEPTGMEVGETRDIGGVSVTLVQKGTS